jgi:hypothetical protein
MYAFLFQYMVCPTHPHDISLSLTGGAVPIVLDARLPCFKSKCRSGFSGGHDVALSEFFSRRRRFVEKACRSHDGNNPPPLETEMLHRDVEICATFFSHALA